MWAPPSNESSPSACSRHLVEREGLDRRPRALGGGSKAATLGPSPVDGGRGQRSEAPRGLGTRCRMPSRFFLSSLGPGSSAACARGSSLMSRPSATDASSRAQPYRADSVLFLGGDLLRLLVGVTCGVPVAGLPGAASSQLSASSGLSLWPSFPGGKST